MELEAENVKNIRSLALCKEKLKVQTSIAEEMEKMAGTYHTSYAEAVKDLYEKNKEIRHQKYKRCRAMMMWCASRSVMLSHYGNEKDSDWFWKWKDKWKKLAEQFKETK